MGPTSKNARSVYDRITQNKSFLPLPECIFFTIFGEFLKDRTTQIPRIICQSDYHSNQQRRNPSMPKKVHRNKPAYPNGNYLKRQGDKQNGTIFLRALDKKTSIMLFDNLVRQRLI